MAAQLDNSKVIICKCLFFGGAGPGSSRGDALFCYQMSGSPECVVYRAVLKLPFLLPPFILNCAAILHGYYLFLGMELIHLFFFPSTFI
ncbi:hypothetical protein FKM82_009271 [Ascaphus truei]